MGVVGESWTRDVLEVLRLEHNMPDGEWVEARPEPKRGNLKPPRMLPILRRRALTAPALGYKATFSFCLHTIVGGGKSERRKGGKDSARGAFALSLGASDAGVGGSCTCRD